MEGRVLWLDDLRPVTGGSVRVADRTGAPVAVLAPDSEGRVHWQAPRPGEYALLVVRVGTAPARAVVVVAPAGGLTFTALLAPQEYRLGTRPADGRRGTGTPNEALQRTGMRGGGSAATTFRVGGLPRALTTRR